MKRIRLGCSLAYEVAAAPTASFHFHVLPIADPEQTVVTEHVETTPALATEITAGGKGERVLRAEVPTGSFEFRYRAEVDVERPQIPANAAPDRPGRLPLSILTYTLPSRYCESDLLAPKAWDLFGAVPDRVAQVQAVCRWVKDNVAYTAGSTDARTSAWDVWQRREGVCRDFVHLSIAFCRALTIPCRYAGCYASGLQPMDFHACFEAYLGGGWRLFDPSEGLDPGGMVVVARGRDATQAGLTTIYGRVTAGRVQVDCAEV